MDTSKLSPQLLVVITQECCSCLATPESLLARPSDKVYFQNLTKETVIVMFPYENLFGVAQLEIGAGQSSALTVRAVDPDAYPYTVYCTRCMEFADKAARPRIIIYDSIL